VHVPLATKSALSLITYVSNLILYCCHKDIGFGIYIPQLMRDMNFHNGESYVYWTVYHCDSCRIKDQLDVTCYFIPLIMCSTCFGH